MQLAADCRNWTRVVVTVVAWMVALAHGALQAQAAEPTVVHVQPGQTLNEAIAEVEGPVCAMLPAGVTEHDAPITRRATVIVKGQGEDVSTLRPSAALGPDEGVALVQHDEAFAGDLILSDFTYDRAFHPGITPGKESAATTGATVLHVGAEGRVILRNLSIHHFDFGAREDQETGSVAFLMARASGQRWDWIVRGDHPADYHQKEILFENVTIDFKKDGGIRHRPGARSRAFDFGLVDRLTIDQDCVFRAHLCQNANPEYTVGPVWRDRGKAGTMYGMNAMVHEYALIDGIYWNCDYGVSRSINPVHEDAVIEWRMDVHNAGYGDQFWHGRAIDGGHMLFKDVRLVGNRTGELWNDYGLRTHGDWKSITVENCIAINRGHPLSIVDMEHQGPITIRNTTLVPVGGGGPGLVIGDAKSIAGLQIDGLHVHADAEAEKQYYNTAIQITETGEGGGLFTISNVLADGYMYNILKDNTGPQTEVVTSNLHGRQVTPDSIVEDAQPIAVFPKKNQSFTVDGNADETADLEPIATIEDFEHADPFSRIDLYMAFDSGPGVFVQVIVSDDEFGNTHSFPTRLYRGDGLQFFITQGRPGEVIGGTLWDIAQHDEHGNTAYRRNFWPDQDLPDGVVDIPMAIKYHEDRQEIVYEFMLPWEEIGLPGPWYEDICVDLIVSDGAEYGAHYKGAMWTHDHESVEGDAIFHPTEPRSQAAQWIRFGQPEE